MIRCKYYLDSRGVPGGSLPHLKLAIHKRGRGAFLPTEIRLAPDQWDAKAQRIHNHPRKDNLNTYLASFRLKVESLIRDMVLSGEAAPMSATQIKNAVAEVLFGKPRGVLLSDVWTEFTAQKEGQTRKSYESTWASVLRYDRHAETKEVSSVDTRWLNGYVRSLSEYEPGTQHLYWSKWIAVLSYCYKGGIIPSIPPMTERLPERTTRRRNLSADVMRQFLSSPPASEQEQYCVDVFLFSFLCRAANPADIFSLRTSDIHNGRIDYQRRKTGKWYSVKIEPELQALIDKLSADGYLCGSRYARPSAAVNEYLRQRAARLGLPPVTMYWARHTFASIAFELGYSMDMVSAALGHSLGGAKITSTYVAIQDYKVDALARAVYDAVLVGQMPK